MSKTITVSVDCVWCNNKQEVTVDSVGYHNWLKGMNIAIALSKANAFERDALKTKMCFDCLSKTLNHPKPGEDWGTPVAECLCCGADIYERNRNSEGDLVCPCCYFNQSNEELVNG